MEQFQPLDISGDTGIRVFGSTIGELFINAAAGLYSLITDLSLIQEKKEAGISAEASSQEGLLVSWLNELIFQFDTYGFIGKKVVAFEMMPKLDTISSGTIEDAVDPPFDRNFRVMAVLSGENFDPNRHEGKLLIKAATYHKLRIEKKDTQWQADIIFDI